MVAALKDLQDVLGRFQDRSVQRAAARDRAKSWPPSRAGRRAAGRGLLISSAAGRPARARDDFAERFAAFAAPEQRALVRATFAKPEP